MNSTFKKIVPFYFIFAGLVFFTILSNLYRDGMFCDGLYYTTISNNLANGIGSFWQPKFTEMIFPQFYDHPPLVFGIESVFFKLLGNSIYVERIYCFIIFLLAGFLIIKTWHLLVKDQQNLKPYSILALILWILNEDIQMGYANNLLESTMSIFVLLSTFLLFLSLEKKTPLRIFYILFASLLLVCAFLCKGFTGLFPLGFFVLYALLYKNISIKTLIVNSAILFVGFGFMIALLLSYEPARNNLSNYMNIQVIGSLSGLRPENSRLSHFHLLGRFFDKNILIILLVSLWIILLKIRNIFFVSKSIVKKSILLCFIGFSGILPIMLSIKQASYYIIAALPFIYMSVALFVSESVSIRFQQWKVNSISYKIFFALSILILISGIIYSSFQWGKIDKRDKSTLIDVHLIGQEIKNEKFVSFKNRNFDGTLSAFFFRHYKISLNSPKEDLRNYEIIEKSIDTITNPKYKLVNLPTIKYNLYKLDSSSE